MRSFEANEAKFDRVYGEGAFKRYLQMKREGFTNVDIAIKFDVSRAAVAQWNRKFNTKMDSLSA